MLFTRNACVLRFAALAVASAAALGCSTGRPTAETRNPGHEPADRAGAERVAGQRTMQDGGQMRLAITAINPLCDIAVLPAANSKIDEQKEILRAVYTAETSADIDDNISTTITLEVSGRRALRMQGEPLVRRFMVRERTGWFTTRAWISEAVSLTPAGSPPHQIMIEGLDGDTACRVSLYRPLEDGGRELVQWTARGQSPVQTVEATSERRSRATHPQVKTGESEYDGEKRDTFRVSDQTERVEIYVLGPEQ